MNRLMDAAQAKLKLIESGKGRFQDDDIIVIKGVWSHPCHVDVTLCATTDPVNRADPAIGPEGRGERPVMDHRKRNFGVRETAIHSLKSFLSFRAQRSTDPYAGLDLSTSNAITPYHLGRINVPVLFLIAGADEQVNPQDLDENMAGLKKGADVSRFFVKGADHGFSKPEHRALAAKGALDWLTKKFPN